jgi:hypothetical protein
MPRGGSSGATKAADQVREHRAGLTTDTLQGVTSMAEQDFTHGEGTREFEPTDCGAAGGASAIRERLAPGVVEVQLRLADGTPLSDWITSPDAFDRAVTHVLQDHPREQVCLQVEEAL